MIWIALIISGLLLTGCNREEQCNAAEETLIQEENYKRLHSETMSKTDLKRWSTLLSPCRGVLAQ